MSTLLKLYQRALFKYPVATQAVQTGFLMGYGDYFAQIFLEKKSMKNYDVLRTAQFAFVGTIFVGPPLRIWYGILDKYIGYEGKATTVKKVVCDQLLFAPVFLASIMCIVKAVQGNSIDEIKERVVHDYPDVLKTNYKIWPAVQLLNFYLVPLQFQVLLVQVVAVFWNTYLSWKMNRNMQVTKS